MSKLNDSKLIFIQIKELIEDEIVKGQLKEHDQIPSTNQMVHFYKVNHITISKGIGMLVDEGVIYKKRGVGMFVADGAREKLLHVRKDAFAKSYVLPMVQEAKKLGLTDNELTDIINSKRKCEHEQS